MKKKYRRYILTFLVFVLLALLIFYFFSFSTQVRIHGLAGKILWEYACTENRSAIILQDTKNNTITFLNVNRETLLNITEIQAYVVYDVQSEKVQRVFKSDKIERSCSFILDDGPLEVLISIILPQSENGMIEIDRFQYGVSKENISNELLFQEKFGDKYVFARYLKNS